MSIDAGWAERPPNHARVELEPIRCDQRSFDKGTACQRIIEKGVSVAIAAPPNDRRDPQSQTHLHACEHPVRPRLSGRKRVNFICLKFNELNLFGPRVVESTREISRFAKPPIDRVPSRTYTNDQQLMEEAPEGLSKCLDDDSRGRLLKINTFFRGVLYEGSAH